LPEEPLHDWDACPFFSAANDLGDAGGAGEGVALKNPTCFLHVGESPAKVFFLIND